jgi:hypothetical protein
LALLLLTMLLWLLEPRPGRLPTTAAAATAAAAAATAAAAAVLRLLLQQYPLEFLHVSLQCCYESLLLQDQLCEALDILLMLLLCIAICRLLLCPRTRSAGHAIADCADSC